MTQDDLMKCVSECLVAANNLIMLANSADVEQGSVQYVKLMYRAAGMVDVLRALGFYVEYDKEENQYKMPCA